MSSNLNSKQFSNLLIFSFFEGRKRWIGILLMIAMPNIFKSITKMHQFILSYIYPRIVSVILTQKMDKEGKSINNFSYKSMCWYIILKYGSDQKALICEGDSTKRNEQIHRSVYKKIPNYFPNSSINITHNGVRISISFYRTAESKNICNCQILQL